MSINKELLLSRIEKLCEEKGIKPTTAYIESGAGKNFKSNMSYAEPTLGKISLLASYFGVSVAYLKGETDEPTPENAFDLFSVPGAIPVKKKKLPVLGSVACGEPIWAEEEYQGYISVDEDINADFCLIAKGDSMIDAGIKDGSIILVRSQPTIENGQIAVVLIDNEATLKRIYFDEPNKSIILNPANPAYSPIIINAEQLQSGQVKILGRAIACQFKLK